jgi:hypothetical protein
MMSSSFWMFPEVALGYFKWRAEPADHKDPIPADLEIAKKADAAAAAVVGDAGAAAAASKSIKRKPDNC